MFYKFYLLRTTYFFFPYKLSMRGRLPSMLDLMP